MSTLAEIEQATDDLPLEQQLSLFHWLSARLRTRQTSEGPVLSILDFPPLDLGRQLRPLASKEELLQEMLDDRL